MKIERRIVEQYDQRAALNALTIGSYADPNKSGDAGRALRMRLGESQNWRCCYCGRQMNRYRNRSTVVTIEHLIPASAGGKICWETCVASCKRCNERGGDLLWKQGMRPLNVPFCPHCGSRQIKELNERVSRCLECRTQFGHEPAEGLPFGIVRFASLRRVAGELLVSNTTPGRLALILRHRMLRLNFTPHAFAAGLIEMAIPAVAGAMLQNGGDLVAAYDAAISELWKHYALKTVKPPRGGSPETFRRDAA